MRHRRRGRPSFTARAYAPGRRRPPAAAPPRPRRSRPVPGRGPAGGPRGAGRPGVVTELFGTADALDRHADWSPRGPRRRAGLRGRPTTALAALAETVTPQGLVAVCRHLRRPAGARRWPTARGWSRCSPRSATRATPAPCCAPPTPPGAGAVVFAGDARRPVQRQVRAGLGRQPVPRRRGPRRADPVDAVDALRAAGLHGARRRRGYGDVDLDDLPTTGGWPRRPPGCSARRRTACPTELAAAPTPGSGCRSTAAPRA